DLSWEAVDYARKQFAAPNLRFIVSNATRVALASASFDAIICFEVIEHLVEQKALLEEVSRLLNEQGILIISTPNRIFYTIERRHVNPFHTREFDGREFRSFLSTCLNHVEIMYHNHIPSLLVGKENLPLQVVA